MKKQFVILLGVLSASIVFCQNGWASDIATVDSFFKESSSFGVIAAVISGIVAAAVIFFTGGAASPIVIYIGTTIGSFAGLSGAAATSYGLALLGGGAVAAGGLGVAGGVAVLTGVLTFSTDVVVNYSVDYVLNEYSYSTLQ